MDFQTQDNLVEAIEEGRIVRVSESYAKREGLPILRKSKSEQHQNKNVSQDAKKIIQREFRDERSKRLLDYLRKPSGWKEKQVISELIQNFNWEISRTRKARGITRKQLASLIGTDEDSIKLIENGLLPSPDFVIINKIQTALNINLRKDKQDFTKEATLKRMKEENKKDNVRPTDSKEELEGGDIEIIED